MTSTTNDDDDDDDGDIYGGLIVVWSVPNPYEYLTRIV